MSKFLQPATLAGAVAIVLHSTVSYAQEQNSLLTLNPIVVTATRYAEPADQIPVNIEIINPQVIQQSPIAELSDLLASDAAINMVQSGGYGQQASIFLRGSNSNQSLVLRDGVRLNSTTSGLASLAFIDTTDIEQIEVLKGPASVLYGSDAIGGVVQLISQIPEKNTAFATGEYGENNTYKAVLGADLTEQNGFYAQVRGQRLETDGTPIKETENNQDAAYDQKGYSAKLGIEQDHISASLDYNQNQGNNTYDSYGTLTNQDFENEILNLKGQVELNNKWILNARLSQFKDDLDQNDLNWMGSYDFIHSTSKEAEFYSQWKITPRQNLLMGVTHRNTEADVISYGTPYDADIGTTGYYLQHQYHHSSLNTQLGLRIEDHDNFGSHTVMQGAIRYQVLPLTSIYTNIGTAFKAPTLNDMYGYGGNPELKPEQSISYEMGIEQKLSQNLSSQLSLYTTHIDDLINFDTTQMENIDKAKIQGGEISAKWQGRYTYLNIGYQYVRAKNDQTKEDLSRRPRQTASITAGWQDEQYGISSTLTANSQYDNSAYDDISIPGHLRIDLHGFYNLNPNLKFFTNIQNIGDSTYRTAYGSGSYYVNGGRLASIGATIRY